MFLRLSLLFNLALTPCPKFGYGGRQSSDMTQDKLRLGHGRHFQSLYMSTLQHDAAHTDSHWIPGLHTGRQGWLCLHFYGVRWRFVQGGMVQ